MSDRSGRRRRAWQRQLGARYDGVHAFLVRVVHPLCFSAFAIMSTVIVGGLAYAIISIAGDSDIIGVVIGIVAVGGSLVIAAFAFVLTPARAAFGLLLLGGWSAGLILVDDIPVELVWTLWIVASLSVGLQVVLLARVVPDRWRNGLMHLLWPASLGTIAGAAPVAAGFSVLAAGDRDVALLMTRAAFAGGAGVLAFLLILHVLARWGDAPVLAEWGTSHGLEMHAGSVPELVRRLVPAFAVQTGAWTGSLESRRVEAITGCTATAAPDLPSVHLTALALKLAGRTSGEHDVWVRRRSWTHDNVLASLGRSEVVEFESYALSSEFDVRFRAGTNAIEAFTMFGPEVVDLLASSLDGAQVCRIGDALILFVVGGVLSAAELDGLLATGQRLAELLERAVHG